MVKQTLTYLKYSVGMTTDKLKNKSLKKKIHDFVLFYYIYGGGENYKCQWYVRACGERPVSGEDHEWRLL